MSSPLPSGSKSNMVAWAPLAAPMGLEIERRDWCQIMPVWAHACSLCLKPWTCNDAHRFCCIPCGHMYGRSCLEWWLQSFKSESAPCPVCRQQFERRFIINLHHVAGNLSGGYCRIEENLRAKLQEQAAGKAEADAKVTELTSLLAEKEQKWREQLAQMEMKSNREMAMTTKKVILVKERIKKMAEEKKGESEELMEFMEQIFPQSSSPAQTPPALAPNGVLKKRGRHGKLPSISKPFFPHNVFGQKQWRYGDKRLLERTSGAVSHHFSTAVVSLAQDAARRRDGACQSHYPARLLAPSPLSSWLMKQRGPKPTLNTSMKDLAADDDAP